MRRPLGWICMAVLLASCNGGGQRGGPGGGPEQPLEPAPPGEVVYEHDFSSPDNGLLGGDATYETGNTPNGNATVEHTPEGELRFVAETEPTAVGFETFANTGGVFAGERELVDLGDTVIVVDATPSSVTAGGNWGIQCRQNPEEGSFYFGLVSIVDGTARARILRSDGYEAEFVVVAEADPLTHPTVAEGTPNELRFDCIGDTLTLHVDGNQVLEGKDSTLTEGTAALAVAVFHPQGTEPGSLDAPPHLDVAFDDLVIREVT